MIRPSALILVVCPSSCSLSFGFTWFASVTCSMCSSLYVHVFLLLFFTHLPPPSPAPPHIPPAPSPFLSCLPFLLLLFLLFYPLFLNIHVLLLHLLSFSSSSSTSPLHHSPPPPLLSHPFSPPITYTIHSQFTTFIHLFDICLSFVSLSLSLSATG